MRLLLVVVCEHYQHVIVVWIDVNVQQRLENNPAHRVASQRGAELRVKQDVYHPLLERRQSRVALHVDVERQ